ncbi:hypothetical protein BD626DRAFT_569781 [Schizophyllum amplum]|uniref:Pre-mRNA-splicing factor RBM22 n=1 Tax=Schizophyllum amplum TaxID=97359 RepID=A0A550CCV0_9AGAR|nr:hypothetical protein BD626DRAFT_569781 [Auriculariopsis ampla]
MPGRQSVRAHVQAGVRPLVRDLRAPLHRLSLEPGTGMRFKTTVICQTCAKVKNVCQTCLLDLEYGLPTQVRDTALGVVSDAPTSDINREYYAQNMEAKPVRYGHRPRRLCREGDAQQLARTDPYYKRNRPHICSFFVKGECKRGSECPYRHEMPVQNELSNQKLQDRYHGVNDPVAKKIMRQHAEAQGLKPPDDESITSLFLSALPASATEASVRARVIQTLPKVQPESIRSVVHVEKSRCAFINFKDRATAEVAAQAWSHGLDFDDGTRVQVKWGRSRPKKDATAPLQRQWLSLRNFLVLYTTCLAGLSRLDNASGGVCCNVLLSLGSTLSLLLLALMCICAYVHVFVAPRVCLITDSGPASHGSPILRARFTQAQAPCEDANTRPATHDARFTTSRRTAATITPRAIDVFWRIQTLRLSRPSFVTGAVTLAGSRSPAASI